MENFLVWILGVYIVLFIFLRKYKNYRMKIENKKLKNKKEVFY